MKASTLGLANLKRIVPNLIEWTAEDTKDYSQLRELYNNVYGQYRRYIGHVTANVGGVYEYTATSDQGKAVYSHVEKSKQQSAIQFLNSNLFQTPEWLIDEAVLARIEETGIVERIRSLQDQTLARLLNPDRLHRMTENTALNNGEAYTVSDMISELSASIYAELNSGSRLSLYRRNLQRTFIEGLERVLQSEKNIYEHSDAKAIARGTLRKLQSQLRRAQSSNELTKYHYADMAARIDEVFENMKTGKGGSSKNSLQDIDMHHTMMGCFED